MLVKYECSMRDWRASFLRARLGISQAVTPCCQVWPRAGHCVAQRLEVAPQRRRSRMRAARARHDLRKPERAQWSATIRQFWGVAAHGAIPSFERTLVFDTIPVCVTF